MAELSERTVEWMDGVIEERDEARRELAELQARYEKLSNENVQLLSESKRDRRAADDLKAAVAGALTNLPTAGAMQGVAVSNQQAATRQLTEALTRANARGPMD